VEIIASVEGWRSLPQASLHAGGGFAMIDTGNLC
jgi:hypothetical protein